MGFVLSSPTLLPGEELPVKHTAHGLDWSPALRWEGAPENTRELALLCEDPDAPGGKPWVHWLLYRIPASATSLPQEIPTKAVLDRPPGAVQGRNSWGNACYEGPRPFPEEGWHRLVFRLYALGRRLDLGPGATREELEAAIEGHVLAKAEIVTRFRKQIERETGT